MAREKYNEIDDTHTKMLALMNQIEAENNMASKLKKQLEHEKIVLEERKAVS